MKASTRIRIKTVTVQRWQGDQLTEVILFLAELVANPCVPTEEELRVNKEFRYENREH